MFCSVHPRVTPGVLGGEEGVKCFVVMAADAPLGTRMGRAVRVLAPEGAESDKHLFPESCLQNDWTDDHAKSEAFEAEHSEAFGGRGRPRSFLSACTTSNPQTHEIQVFHSNSRLSKVFWNPCLGNDTIWRPGQGDEGICRQRKHVDK